MTVDELHRKMTEGFAELRRENPEFGVRFDQIHARFEQIDARFREREETIGRSCDVLVEKIEAWVRLVAEAQAHLTTLVGNHEVPLEAIENRS